MRPINIFISIYLILSISPALANTSTTPIFTLIDMEGVVHTNKSAKGKYLVINFWASWCKPCLQGIPPLVELYKNNKSKVLVLGLAYEEPNKEKTNNHIDSLSINYPIVLFSEENKKYFSEFVEVVGMPTTNIYTPDGKLLYSKPGELNTVQLEQILTW